MQSRRRNPLYFATPDAISEDINGPMDGMTAGCRQIENWRDWDGTSAERVTDWNRDVGSEPLAALSAH
jgi:hypothetical protein